MKVILKKLRLAVTPRSSLLWTQLDNGTTIAGYNRPGFGGRGVYIYGDSLEPELFSLQHFLKPGFVMIDVGANVGVYALKAAREVGPSGLVIAIEPFLETAYRLSNNIRANGYRNVRVRNLCISQRTEEAQFYLNEHTPNSFGLFPKANAESISVLTVSLDDLCQWEGLNRLDYLKVDAEEAENLILAGAVRSIALFRPIIQLETTMTSINRPLPEEYRTFTAPNSPNVVLLPSENEGAIGTAKALGWTEPSHV